MTDHHTYLDYYNYYLKEFLNSLVNYFPFVKQGVLSNYRNFLEGNEDKSDLYVKYFVDRINNRMIDIARKNEEIFKDENVFLVEGVDFHIVWNSSEANPQNKEAIWKYLRLLMLYARKVVPSKKEIDDLLNKIGNVVNAPDKVEKNTHLCSRCRAEDGDEEDNGFVNILEFINGFTGKMENDKTGGSNKFGSMMGMAFSLFSGKGDIKSKINTISSKVEEYCGDDSELLKTISGLKEVLLNSDLSIIKTKLEKWSNNEDNENNENNENNEDNEDNENNENKEEELDISKWVETAKKLMIDTFDLEDKTEPFIVRFVKEIVKPNSEFFDKMTVLARQFSVVIKDKLRDYKDGKLTSTDLISFATKFINIGNLFGDNSENGNCFPNMDKLQKIQKIIERNPHLAREISELVGGETKSSEIETMAEEMGATTAQQNRLKENNRALKQKEKLRAKLEAKKNKKL
jgi:hypothetical protein